MNIRILDRWDDGYDSYFTIGINKAECVDVKYMINIDFMYVMECANGYEVYRIGDNTGNGTRNITSREKEAIDWLIQKGD